MVKSENKYVFRNWLNEYQYIIRDNSRGEFKFIHDSCKLTFMNIQLIKDENGNNTGVFVPINDWNRIIEMHEDLNELVKDEPKPKRKFSALAGTLSKETADAMQKYVEQSRTEWDERLEKQF